MLLRITFLLIHIFHIHTMFLLLSEIVLLGKKLEAQAL